MPEQVVGQGQGLAGNGLGSPNVLVEQGQVAELLHDVDTVCLNVKFYPALDFRAKVGVGTGCQVMTTYISNQTGGPGTGPGNPDPPTDPPAIGSTFTTFALHADAQQIHVSESEGNDGNTGLTTNTPVKTIQMGLNKIREGRGDHLLLKRGDTWSEYQPYTLLGKSGRSATNPTYIGPYGTGALPVIRGWFTLSSDNVTYLAMQGLNLSMLYSDRAAARAAGGNITTYNPTSLTFKGPTSANASDIWIEGCRLVGARQAAQFQRVSNVTFRRNTVLDTYALSDTAGTTKPHAQGIFLGSNGGQMRIEENVFDRCGGTYNAENLIVDGTDAGVTGVTVGCHRTWFNHAIYFSQGGQPANMTATITENLISRSGLAVQLRTGGTLSNNVMVRNARSLQYGHHQNAIGTVGGTIDSNLVMLSENTATSSALGNGAWQWNEQAQATGFDFDKIDGDLTISNNIVCQHSDQDADYGPLNDSGTLTNVRSFNFNSKLDANKTINVTFDNNATRNWDNPDQFTPAEHEAEVYVRDIDSDFNITQTNKDYGNGLNTSTDIPAAVWAALAGVSSEATYLTKVRGFQYGSAADVEDAWTSDYHATVYTAANAAL